MISSLKGIFVYVFLALALFLWGEFPVYAAPGDLPTTLVEVEGTSENVIMPDWSKISFSDFSPLKEGGSFSLPGAGTIEWEVGAEISAILNLWTIKDLSPQLLSISEIASLEGLPFSAATGKRLENFPLARKQTFDHLLEVVPGLEALPLDEFAPLEEVVSAMDDVLDFDDFDILDAEVGAVVQKLGLGDSKLETLNVLASEIGLDDFKLGDYGVGDIPGLVDSPLGALKDWGLEKLTDIPLLEDLPLSMMPNPITLLGGFVARADRVWGEAEGAASRTISGGNKVGFKEPCEEKPCAAIELDDVENEGKSVQMMFEGERWVSGESQEVDGGSGCLSGVSDGDEPTGRHPFGNSFKFVLWDLKEAEETFKATAFFRFCTFCGCTPYFIGPIPLLTFDRDDYVLVGKLDGEGGATNPVPPPSNLPNNPVTPSQWTSGGSPVNPCQGNLSSSQLPEEVVNDVTAQLESSSNPTAVGVYGCDEGNANCGRGLGLFDIHSSNPLLRETVSLKEGGQVWLEKIDAGYEPTPQEVEQYFTVVDQNEVFESLISDSLEDYDGENIEPIVEDWLGGDAATSEQVKALAASLQKSEDAKSQGGCSLGDLNLSQCSEKAVIYATEVKGNTVANAASSAVPQIIQAAEEAGISEQQLSYILATVLHESNMGATMYELADGDPVTYFNNKYSYRSDLGNQGGNDGYNYRGRGYVQLTGRTNYQKYTNLSQELFGESVDFVNNPDLAADPEYAAGILIHGMSKGGYTGRSLDQYINAEQVDYYNARRVVNGTDQASKIAGYAESFSQILASCTQPATQTTGNFVNPASGYPVTSEFGPRKSPCSGCSSFHKGIDLGTPTGTPLIASDGGRVIYAQWSSGYGYTVFIEHSNGVQTRYSHLSQIQVGVGQEVAQGDQIAFSGASGIGTGPHLDFGFYTDFTPGKAYSGTARNPREFVKDFS